ncbi:hypothetical protein [Paenibacillus xanthanilyticus]|uniref:Phage protein n=1 Tax=Paenibacillus xanthanilyticus TaxID=1783531 RepID=A0ABV8JZT1_9BACL
MRRRKKRRRADKTSWFHDFWAEIVIEVLIRGAFKVLARIFN